MARWRFSSLLEVLHAAAGATTGHLATDLVIYNTSTGTLYYDADGIGSGAAMQIRVLDNNLTLAYTDLFTF
jgi:Ca2+-binding RTX toxin-like protein